MGVATHTYDADMVESALFRSGGVNLNHYAYGPATNPAKDAGFRNYKVSGKKVGHAYIHLEGDGDDVSGHGEGLAKKSRYADHDSLVGVIVEILNHPLGQAALGRLDLADPAEKRQEWLHGLSGVPIVGNWYGFAQNSTVKTKITKASINIRSHGDALFISSTYPEF